MKQFLSAHDVQNIPALIQDALAYKAAPWKDEALGKHKKLGCLFMNPSMRTRLSTQIAAQQLGMETVIFNVGNEGLVTICTGVFSLFKAVRKAVRCNRHCWIA